MHLVTVVRHGEQFGNFCAAPNDLNFFNQLDLFLLDRFLSLVMLLVFWIVVFVLFVVLVLAHLCH